MKTKFAFPICTFLVLAFLSLPSFAQEEENAPQAYLMWEDVVKPSMYDAYVDAIKLQMKTIAEAGSEYPISIYETSDYKFYFIIPMKDFAGIDAMFDSFTEMGKEYEEAFDKVDAAYKGTFEYTMPRIFYHNAKLSYSPEEPMEGLKDAKFFYLGECFIEQGHGKEVGKLFGKFKEMYTEKGIPRGYNVYWGSFGFENPYLFWTSYDMNAAEFWAHSKKFNEMLGEDAKKTWVELEKHLRKFQYRTGWYRDDLSYYPPKEE